MTRGTVVVEAGLRSGSLTTASEAAKVGRVVAAVPGPVTSMISAGCHELIRAGEAVLVTDAAEAAEALGEIGRDLAPVKRGPDRPGDDMGEARVGRLAALPVRPGCARPTLPCERPWSNATSWPAWADWSCGDWLAVRGTGGGGRLDRPVVEHRATTLRTGLEEARDDGRPRVQWWPPRAGHAWRGSAVLAADQRACDGFPVTGLAVDAVDAFERHLRAERGRSEHTTRAYLGDVRSLLTFLAEDVA